MSNRVEIPKPIETELLRLSARRCCLCYGLHQDLEEKEGQIAHLDKDNSNNKIDNLAWLCMERVHHSYYDSKTSQHKNYTIQEVKSYRKDLYSAIEEKRIKVSETILKSNIGKGYYERFSAAYIGRTENVQYVLDFLNNPDQHFMLLYGVGGMGKSHLISECRKQFSNPELKQTECTSNYNLKSLFETCGINYPKELRSNERIKFFIDEFIKQNICVILDDFYETIDTEIRGMLPKLAAIPYGKILLVSRALPKELDKVGFRYNRYLLPPLEESDFNKVLEDYVLWKEKNDPQSLKLSLTKIDLKKIYEKAQGYPLGGQLIINLLFSMEKLDNILKDLPKFDAELDEEGKQFSGRLLDNIFKKGNQKEIQLLCEFSALFGASSKEIIKQLPSWKLPNSLMANAFETLVNRRRFIYKDENGNYNSHAMIKDFAYEKLADKPAVHSAIGKYFERELLALPVLNSNLLEAAIQHYKRVGIHELQRFGQRVDRKFGINNVKSLIEENVKDTIRNYKSLLEIYPNKMAFWNELGIAYRLNNQKQQAIETFLKAEKIEPTNIRILNELGITYRENNQKTLAIDTFLKAISIGENALPSYNELGITYRKIGKYQLAIDTFLKRLELEPNEVRSLNELGITYRENNQKPLAIETFLKAEKIEPTNVWILNELGITYREMGKVEEAIIECNKGLRIQRGNKLLIMNLLQIYIFFKPDKDKAKENYDALLLPPRGKHFSINRNHYLKLINWLNSIYDLSIEDFKVYDKYLDWSLRDNIKAYHNSLELLFRLNKKFPNNLKIVSRLGRTLSNQFIARNQEGRTFLMQAITLSKEEWVNEIHETKKVNFKKQYEDHIFYYLYNLLNYQQKEALQTEIDNYQNDIKNLAKYHHFLARYFEFLEKTEEGIISSYEVAINISESPDEKLKSFEALLDYMTTKNETKYRQRIEELKKIINALNGK